MGKFFHDRFGTASLLTVGKLDMRTYSKRQIFMEEQHAEYVNLMELREVKLHGISCFADPLPNACPGVAQLLGLRF